MHNTLPGRGGEGKQIANACLCVCVCGEGSSPAPVDSDGAVRGHSVYGSGPAAELDYVFSSRSGCKNVKRNS
jgi:hypothetical protein